MNRANQLQFLRFIAFGMIFMLHGSAWNFMGVPVKNGAIEAVSFFIILSGTVTGYSGYEKNPEITLKDMCKYMKRKVCKVYPLYIGTTLFTIIYMQIPYLVSKHDYVNVLKNYGIQLVKNFFLLQSWFPTGYFSFNGVGWFLSTIMFLYLFNLPSLWFLNKVNKRKYRYYIFVGIFILSILTTVLYCYIMRNYNAEFWMYVFPPARLGEYFSGIVIGYAVRALKQQNWNMSSLRYHLTYLELGALTFWIGMIYSSAAEWKFRIVQWLIPNIILLIIFTIGEGYISKVFSCRVFEYLGDISFECFLIHQIIQNLYMKLNGDSVSRIGDAFALVFCMCTTIFLAILLRGKEGNICKQGKYT